VLFSSKRFQCKNAHPHLKALVDIFTLMVSNIFNSAR